MALDPPTASGPTGPSDQDRSGRRKRLVRRTIVLTAAVLALVAVGRWRYFRHNFKRFQEVRPDVLYRMGQPSEYGLRKIAETYGLRTILCLREDDPRLKAGLFYDPGQASGRREADYAADLGIRFLHWPLGKEAHWPWPTPWHLEHFYRLFDDPANYPVLVHCTAGKHRAGTFCALFRLEYDRWDVERVLAEMVAFGFGTPQTIQEHNLRTYLPRPRPGAAERDALWAAFGGVLEDGPPADYEVLVRRLRAERDRPAVRAALEDYLANERPFAVCLGQRLIDARDDPLAPKASELARRHLARSEAAACDWSSSAALLADFGSPAEQHDLLALLEAESRGPGPTPRYQAVVAGVTNRYTRNRIAHLRPLLADLRLRGEPGARQYRYADTAVARLTSILDTDFLGVREGADRAAWDRGIEAAQRWFAERPERQQPGPLCQPQLPWKQGRDARRSAQSSGGTVSSAADWMPEETSGRMPARR